MKFAQSLLVLMLLAGTLSAAEYPPDAPIDPSAVHLQPMEQNGIAYVQGGIGEDESRTLQQTSGYNLHITLSSGVDNKYLSGVDLTVQSANGNPVLTLQDVGPLVYVKLPAGHYQVLASFEGEQSKQAVTVNSQAPATLNLHWR
ncbi:carboxypeptidase regulatory-like domain-containing protein [Pseudomonas fontis]|uniref:Carboxypeptidase regulatory-like domain-containing protein n=1 Tax=Pseudomonas fontis TaxID=2942633 RepID=A0ABT5NWD4_9PSED|nr:carboxypeptidase regulatory-like domain-containing protein [Pseudomonas fontis]MDD0976213.1 carboxypeptidase regulatory-like domain-containing protein [Pseudomonas fontis]MDD0992489.1 carboxypeptidase regulatory-like domain-containing protein [Pseudomonas fontis]